MIRITNPSQPYSLTAEKGEPPGLRFHHLALKGRCLSAKIFKYKKLIRCLPTSNRIETD